MRSSEQVTTISKAMADFNKNVPSISKNKTVSTGKYSFSYADLDSLLSALRKPLADNGLFHINSLITSDGTTSVVTRLYHTSGEWFESLFPIPSGVLSQGPQAIGGQITYGKRYNLTSLLGIAADDDTDAQQEVTPSSKKPEPKKMDSATEDMRTLFNSIKDGITNAVNVGEIEGLKSFWSATASNIDKLQSFNATAAQQLQDRYDSGLKALLKKGN